MRNHYSLTVAALVCALAAAPGASAQPHSPASAAVHQASPGAAKHMMFRVRGSSGATLYLLGSVHLLSAEAGKLPPEVDSAFARAQTIAFETNLDTAQLRAQEIMARGRYSDGTTLRTALSPATAAHTDSVLHAYGLSIDQVNPFKPWLVSILVSQLLMQRANYQAQYGVEMQLNARAHTAGKTILGLESIDVQIGMFDHISPADQEKMLQQSGMPEPELAELRVITTAWSEGNVVALDSLLNSKLASSPAAFATLVTDRNKSWIPKIEELLKGNGDALVVVGAAHLVGTEGVVALLKARGYSVEQM